MKRRFRIIVGMLLLAIPLCMNAQVKPEQNPPKDKALIEEKQKAEKEKMERKEKERKERAEKERMERAEKEKREKEATAKLEKGKPEKPKDPKGGLEMPKISGFVQGMYQANLDENWKLMEGDKASTFRMRRVRMSIEGNLAKGLSYKIQGDFTRKPMLVDAYVKYKPCNEFAIQVGQFKTPFSIESPINPVNLEIFDYGESVQKLIGYDDVCGVGSLGRDLGIMATGSFFPIKGDEKIDYHIINYSIGVFNGNGANEKDNNNRKDLVGRLEVHPGLKAITLSGSYYYGKYTKEDNINCTRNRWAAGAQYNDGKLVLRGEYIGGTTGWLEYSYNDHTGLSEDAIENFYNSNGYYAQAGYYFGLGKEKSQKLMPVLRYEHFNANTASVDGGTNWYTAGLNYWPLKSVNCKIDYSLVEQVLEKKAYSHRLVAMVSYKF